MTEWLDVGLSTRIKVGPPDESPTMPNGDRYPKIIRDQREEYGCTTVDEVRTFWVRFIERQAEQGVGPGAIFRDEQGRAVVPFVNPGPRGTRWIALCPECSGGMICWEDNPDACCVDCGRVFEVHHHTGPIRAEVSRLLAARPRQHRCWDAHKGETVLRLKTENVIHGWGATVSADGLETPSTIVLPDGVTTTGEFLDRLKTAEAKAR